MEEKILDELRLLNKLIASLVLKDLTQNDKISSLKKLDIANKDIANLLGMTNNQVNVTLSKLNKSKKK